MACGERATRGAHKVSCFVLRMFTCACFCVSRFARSHVNGFVCCKIQSQARTWSCPRSIVREQEAKESVSFFAQMNSQYCLLFAASRWLSSVVFSPYPLERVLRPEPHLAVLQPLPPRGTFCFPFPLLRVVHSIFLHPALELPRSCPFLPLLASPPFLLSRPRFGYLCYPCCQALQSLARVVQPTHSVGVLLWRHAAIVVVPFMRWWVTAMLLSTCMIVRVCNLLVVNRVARLHIAGDL